MLILKISIIIYRDLKKVKYLLEYQDSLRDIIYYLTRANYKISIQILIVGLYN